MSDAKMAGSVKIAIEAIRCRSCGAERASCISPQKRSVYVAVAFEGQDHRSDFCYERLHDYIETVVEPFRVALSKLSPIGTPIGISEEEVEALREVRSSVRRTSPLALDVIDRLIASATGGAIVYTFDRKDQP